MSIKWRKDWGDGYETDDSVLWINNEPTNNCVSGYGDCQYAYINDKQVSYIFESRSEAKAYLLGELGLC